MTCSGPRDRWTGIAGFVAAAEDADQAAARRAVVEGEAELLADLAIFRFAADLARDLDASRLGRIAPVDEAAATSPRFPLRPASGILTPVGCGGVLARVGR